MYKHSTSTGVQNLQASLKSAPDTLAWPQIFEAIGKSLPLTVGLVTSTLPRGTLQVVQPSKVSESLVKAYGKEFHAEDRATWAAIRQQKPLRASEVWEAGTYELSRYVRDFLQPHGLRYLAVAPLKGPVFEGYPGAIHLYRSADQGDFSDAELAELGEMVTAIDEATQSARAARVGEATLSAWGHRAPSRQFVFNAQIQPQWPAKDEDLAALDERLWQQMAQDARQRLTHLADQESTSDRLQLPDTRGDLWTFRAVALKNYPALGGGAFVIYSLQPECLDWSILQGADFQADRDVARLIPALKFMKQEFHRSPTLGEIAKTVHLSPFHFHRQFTEMLGLTPKHFLLECQIEEAKKQLIARQKDLAKIATDCGFAHQSHFTSRFKQATGLTPTRWRRLASERSKSVGA